MRETTLLQRIAKVEGRLREAQLPTIAVDEENFPIDPALEELGKKSDDDIASNLESLSGRFFGGQERSPEFDLIESRFPKLCASLRSTKSLLGDLSRAASDGIIDGELTPMQLAYVMSILESDPRKEVRIDPERYPNDFDPELRLRRVLMALTLQLRPDHDESVFGREITKAYRGSRVIAGVDLSLAASTLIDATATTLVRAFAEPNRLQSASYLGHRVARELAERGLCEVPAGIQLLPPRLRSLRNGLEHGIDLLLEGATESAVKAGDAVSKLNLTPPAWGSANLHVPLDQSLSLDQALLKSHVLIIFEELWHVRQSIEVQSSIEQKKSSTMAEHRDLLFSPCPLFRRFLEENGSFAEEIEHRYANKKDEEYRPANVYAECDVVARMVEACHASGIPLGEIELPLRRYHRKIREPFVSWLADQVEGTSPA